jgi:hemolysin activation/secretion protein
MWKFERKRRVRVNLPLKVILLAITYYLFAPVISIASAGSQSEVVFKVKQLKITGNTLISTRTLLEKLPLCYIDYEEKDPNTGEARINCTYNFKVLYEIILRPGEERDIDLETIQGLTKYILSQYSDYAGIYVYVPADTVEGTVEKKLRDGILEIKILEGRVANVTVGRYDLIDPNRTLLDPDDKAHNPENKRGYLKSSVLKSWSPVKAGDVIKIKELDYFVKLLNLNPDRHVRHYVSRSRRPDALNLSYDIYETSPWHLYLQADNAGTNDRQWAPRVAIISTNLTGIDDRFSAVYQAPWEKGIENEYSVYGNYGFPLYNPRLRLNVYGGYSQFDITPEGGAGINFIGNGSFYGSVLSYNILQIDSLFIDLTGSLSKERSKVTPSLGLTSDVDMDLWGLGINIYCTDDISNTYFTFIGTSSMGGSSRSEFQLAREKTDPDFTIYNAAASHSRFLDPQKVNLLSGSFRYITSDERLVPAKMTTFGGLYSVRGYKEDEIVADGGIIASGQYEFDLVKYNQPTSDSQANSKKAHNTEPWLKRFAPLVFIDYGWAKTKSPVLGEQETQELCSAGVGVIVGLSNTFDASLYCGWPLRPTEETDEGDVRLNVSLRGKF